MNHDITDLRRTPESDIARAAVDDVERAIRGGDPAVFEIVRDLVKRPGVDPHVRAALLLQLVALPSKDTERVLLDALHGDQPDVVRVRACDALGQAGTESALPVLEKIASDAAGPLRTQAAFGHVLISHRLRRPSKLLESLTEGERASIGGVGGAFASGALTPIDRAEVFGYLREGRWKAAPLGHHAAAIQCGGRSWAVLPLCQGSCRIPLAA